MAERSEERESWRQIPQQKLTVNKDRAILLARFLVR